MKKKGKGLSFDQKREKMLQIFHKTKDVFNFDEIEKLSIKAGIPFPSVKQILDSLKGDSLVQCQKIGAGVFYWSFPSKALQIMNDRLDITTKQNTVLREQIQTLEREIGDAEIGRQLTEQRKQKEQDLESLRLMRLSIQQQIEKLVRFDPQRYQLLLKQNNEVKKMLNLEVDNLEQINKYIKKNNPGINVRQIEQAYGIPATLQYYD